MQLLPVPAFSDNYIWLLADGPSAWVVDPGDATVVLQALAEKKLALAGILLTHHHGDHSGGITALLQAYQVPVYGAAVSAVPELVSCKLAEGDYVRIGPWQFTVIAVPGHTLDHIAFYSAELRLLFCGDTLFSAGCGRVFEGTNRQMYESLLKLAALPDDTRVCCAHEYTLSNLRFAVAVEPDNPDIQNHLNYCEQLRSNGQPTVPSTLVQEKTVNPFLRCKNAEEFAVKREWKNGF